MSGTDILRISFVCTGNICRSPMPEMLQGRRIASTCISS
ncbi:MAG: hypothetical protein ACNYNX_02595 [Leucobacter sp.]